MWYFLHDFATRRLDGIPTMRDGGEAFMTVLFFLRIMVVFCLVLGTGGAAGALSIPLLAPKPLAGDWERIEPLLEKILNENILSFWLPRTLDSEHGGYYLNHDIQGRPKGPAKKQLVVQARCVWFYSRLINEGRGTGEIRQAARHGYEFLRDKMWDKQHGGFYWEVDETGTNATMPDKHLYGQAFGLYALSEYAMAFQDAEALGLAQQLFRLLDFTAHDSTHGGYFESFQRDWSYHADPTGRSYMGVPHNLKLMNTHLHLMEAMTAYVRASADPVGRERLRELITIQSNAVVRKKLGACTDQYTWDWTPLEGKAQDRVSYGHDLENIWLLMEACEAAGITGSPLRDLYKTLFAYSLQYGYDEKQGGFYDSGPFHQSADRRGKVFWVQAEALVAALKMYQWTGEEVYYRVFDQTLNWINTRQADWQYGDWFSTISESGDPTGDKANAWKGPYHNGRAMLECLKVVKKVPKP